MPASSLALLPLLLQLLPLLLQLLLLLLLAHGHVRIHTHSTVRHRPHHLDARLAKACSLPTRARAEGNAPPVQGACRLGTRCKPAHLLPGSSEMQWIIFCCAATPDHLPCTTLGSRFECKRCELSA
jgi:hypothetical protein